MDCGYYEERIDFVEFGGNWEENVNTVFKFHTKRELCLPYEQAWPPQKQIGFENPRLAPFSWKGITMSNMTSTDIELTPIRGIDTTPVYTETEPSIEERVFVDEDYVVMGSIKKKNWVEKLWDKVVEVK